MYERTRRAGQAHEHRMRGRIALAAALIALTAANAFSAGPKDTIIKVSIEWSNGTTYVVVDAQKPTHAVLMKDKGGQKSYYSPDGGDIAQQGSARDAAIRLSQAATTKDSQIAFPASVPLTRLSARRGGAVPQDIDHLKQQRETLMRIPLWEYGSELTCELSFILGGELFRLSLGGVLEFVPGERELFAKFPAASYEDKAYSLLAGAVGSEATVRLRSGLVEAGKTAPVLDVFKNEAGKVEYEKAKGGVLRTIGKHYLWREERARAGDELMLTSVHFSEQEFRRLYGRSEERNPYIFGYAAMSAAYEKPLLSHPAKRSLGLAIPYDWKKYKTISAAESAQLAENALRYLTGGVEYSQMTVGGDLRDSTRRTDGDDNRVYASHKALLDSWAGVGAVTDKARRPANYLPPGTEWTTPNSLDSGAKARLVGALDPATLGLRTPFVIGTAATAGNPLPFVPGGIDTPRSFAYKMSEQVRALNLLLVQNKQPAWTQSAAPGGNPKAYASYLDFALLLKRGVSVDETKELPNRFEALTYEGYIYKPFLPGAYPLGKDAEKEDRSSYYRSDMSAGVDSAGLLAGTLGMTPALDSVADARNRRVGVLADAYSGLMAESKKVKAWVDRTDELQLTGLDARGQPSYADQTYGRRYESVGPNLSISDLERMTILVPHARMLRRGDLIVGRDGEGRPHIGIVVAHGAAPDYDADPDLWMSQVHVVTIRRGTLVASLAVWGNSAPLFGGFSSVPQSYQIRRLLAYDKERPASTVEREPWEAMVLEADRIEWALSGTELTSTVEYREPWLWVPNTGETLNLTLTGSARISKDETDTAAFVGKAVRVAIKDYLPPYYQPGGEGAPEAVANKEEGTLFYNKGDGLELGYFDAKTFVVLMSLKFNGLLDGTGSHEYRLSYNPTYFTATGWPVQTEKPTSKKFGIGADGALRFDGKPIAVRPIVAKYENTKYGGIRPGDDYELEITIQGSEGAVQTWSPSARLAVYDKKLLWRANLYIDEEPNSDTKARDWNTIHPWAAPTDSSASMAIAAWQRRAMDGGLEPLQWTGANEWNRKFSVTTEFKAGGKSVGLNNLKSDGNGGQVVTFPEFTPVRGLPNTLGEDEFTSPHGNNKIGGTVAYSYPIHRYENPDTWTDPVLAKKGSGTGLPEWKSVVNKPASGDQGSMDSPFDYVWKLRQQGQATAPGNSWWNYTVTMPAGDIDSKIAENERYKSIRFIPSLGLYLGMPGHGYVEINEAEDGNESDPDTWKADDNSMVENADLVNKHWRRNASWIIEAGVDCVGFAQRSASYANSVYSWTKLKPGVMDGDGEPNVYKIIANSKDRSYPTNYSRELVTIFANLDLSTNQKERLRLAVPGDVFQKDSNDPDANYSNHIALIGGVDLGGMLSIDQTIFLKSYKLIEGEYVERIQSVVNVLTLNDYHKSIVAKSYRIYEHYKTRDSEPSVDLKCTGFQIRRLK